MNRHTYVGFFGPRHRWATCRQQGLGLQGSGRVRCQALGSLKLGGSQRHERATAHSLGLLPQHSPILGCTPPRSGFRKCRGREAGRACFPSVLSVCVHLEGRAGLQCALWESRAQEGQPGRWKTQDWSRGSTRGKGEVSLEQRRHWERGGVQ